MQLNPRYVINIKHRLLSNYIPKHKPPSQFDITRLEHFIGTSSKILVLTGAGISTESGIFCSSFGCVEYPYKIFLIFKEFLITDRKK